MTRSRFTGKVLTEPQRVSMTVTEASATPEQGATQQKGRADDWRSIVARYQRPNIVRALYQFFTTIFLLALAYVLMYHSMDWSYWATLALALPTGGLLVRTFIIMHDCAHGSFLPSRRLNDLVGYFTGVLTMTPFGQWRREHAIHHASSGDLDRRGFGDIDTLTVREYLSRSKLGRLKYRLYRNPLTLLGLGPIHMMLLQRFRERSTATGAKQQWSVWGTNIGIAVGVVLFSWWLGFGDFFRIYFPTIYIAGAAGVWLFYVQHQFEDAYWERHGEWDYATAAVEGSSYFKLPGILNWFTGSIGLHHVHHLGPKIPNYRLKRAHEENPFFHRVHVVKLREAVSVLRLSLWDEDQKKLVAFRDIRGRAVQGA